MSNDQPKKSYRVEATRHVEVYQWVEAESPEEAKRIAKEDGESGLGVWEVDHIHEPESFFVDEEGEE